MLVIPALDLKDGRCVRLYQGEMDRETVYDQDPLEAARRWVDQGASLLHVVDLSGAVAGRPIHLLEIKRIREAFGIAIEFGGGLRSMESIKGLLDSGVDRVVVGTRAHEDRSFLRTVCESFAGRIVVGIDAREGRVAVKGWQEKTATDAVDLARRCEEDGATRIIYTDIGRDGTGLGVNVDETLKIARAVKVPVIASGGVSSLEDIQRIKAIEGEGVEGVIVGRAIYSGTFTLKEAISAATGPH